MSTFVSVNARYASIDVTISSLTDHVLDHEDIK